MELNKPKDFNKTKHTAMDEAGLMMLQPMNQLPKAAIEFLRYMSSRVGFCGEVCVTAYAYYSQAVLNLPCDDPGYKIDPDALNWFREHNYC